MTGERDPITAYSILPFTGCAVPSGNFPKKLPPCRMPAMLTIESKTL
jgi:hypothetical protein